MRPNQMHNNKTSFVHHFIGIILLSALYYGLFSPYFDSGYMGNDYLYFLPMLLDEYIYARVNGWLSPQWFTPSFCGGFVGLANPQSMYWSAPHLLTALFSPAQSVFITMLAFAALGGLGVYLFLSLRYSTQTSFVCALLFATNGYHLARMLEGHLGHHGFMLAPLIAWIIARKAPDLRSWSYWRHLVCTALLVAYLILSGASPILPQLALVILLFLAFAHAVHVIPLNKSLQTSVYSALFAALLVGPVLYSKISFMITNPRTWSPLPQFDSLYSSIVFGFAIIVAPIRDTGLLWQNIINPEVLLGWHEFEYGLTSLPLLIIFIYFIHVWTRTSSSVRSDRQSLQATGLALFIAISTLPFLVNAWLSESFVELVRRLPILGSTSSLFRWHVISMCSLLLITAPLLEQITGRYRSLKRPIATYAVISVIALHYGFFIRAEIDSRPFGYNNMSIEAAYSKIRDEPSHSIARISWDASMQRNDAFIDGASQLQCYEAAFG
jgi:hypothetical protein